MLIDGAIQVSTDNSVKILDEYVKNPQIALAGLEEYANQQFEEVKNDIYYGVHADQLLAKARRNRIKSPYNPKQMLVRPPVI